MLPLLPLYVGYLAGNTRRTDENGKMMYDRKTVMLHTIFFVLGISTAFFLLGFSFSAVGQFFGKYKDIFTVVGGIIIVFLGLLQLGVLNLDFLNRDFRLNVKNDIKKMNPFTAFVMGFTFSFAWTPCVGPALSSVLLMASSSGSAVGGVLLVALYALGFVIPFLALGLFTAQVLEFLKKKRKILSYAVKAGGALLVIIGILMMTGWINSVNVWLSGGSTAGEGNSTSSSQQTTGESDNIYDFTLYDQYGTKHTLSDYKGKVVFLNFWTTWCGYCKEEMPDIQKLYEEYGCNKGDVVFLGVAMPSSDDNPQNADGTKKSIEKFLSENEYTFPVVFDTTGNVAETYMVHSFPMTFLIDKEGELYGYASGMMTEEMMINAIEQTMSGEREK